MQAAVLVRTGKAAQAFEIQTRPDLEPAPDQIRIAVEAFGLNFADVMARLGKYQDAPKRPCVLGYEVVGRVDKLGAKVEGWELGQRVLAFTRFGGYATQVVVAPNQLVPIPEDLDAGEATALCVQYCTAYYAACYLTNLYEGDKVLVQSAAGGVGTALIQLAKWRGCVVYGTAGSAAKLDYLRAQGVDFPINYQTQDFETEIGRGKLDVMFDAVGGDAVKKGMRLLRAGGRMICYGASSLSQRGIFGTIAGALGFGFYHPVQLMMPSRSILGVNMLRVADERPEVLLRCLQSVVDLYKQGIARPVADSVLPIAQLAQAHERLETRQSSGKIAVRW